MFKAVHLLRMYDKGIWPGRRVRLHVRSAVWQHLWLAAHRKSPLIL